VCFSVLVHEKSSTKRSTAIKWVLEFSWCSPWAFRIIMIPELDTAVLGFWYLHVCPCCCTFLFLVLFRGFTSLCDFFIGRFGVCQNAFRFKKFELANISIPSKENVCQCACKIFLLFFCSLYRVWLRSCLRFRDKCAGHTVLFARYRTLTPGIVHVWKPEIMEERDCTIDFICHTLFILAPLFPLFFTSLLLSERIPLGFGSVSTFVNFVLHSSL